MLMLACESPNRLGIPSEVVKIRSCHHCSSWSSHSGRCSKQLRFYWHVLTACGFDFGKDCASLVAGNGHGKAKPIASSRRRSLWETQAFRSAAFPSLAESYQDSITPNSSPWSGSKFDDWKLHTWKGRALGSRRHLSFHEPHENQANQMPAPNRPDLDARTTRSQPNPNPEQRTALTCQRGKSEGHLALPRASFSFIQLASVGLS